MTRIPRELIALGAAVAVAWGLSLLPNDGLYITYHAGQAPYRDQGTWGGGGLIECDRSLTVCSTP